MIQIDDSGSGSLIGGTGIGVLDTEKNSYYFEIIPLLYYQTDLYDKKMYQDYVIDIVKRAFRKLNVTRNHKIEVCQGYMFDKLRNWLTLKGYNFKSTKIEDPLQYKVEESFNNYVISLGLPKEFIKHARFAFGFHRLLKWVFADLENRKKLCKTQWKSWHKWANVEKSIYHNKLTYPDYCLKCGKKLKPSLNVITIEYITNKPATINLHKKCYNGKLNEVPPLFLREFTTKIKLFKKKLDEFYKNNNELYFEIDNGKLNVVTSSGDFLGNLKNSLESKLIFWIKKGFKWKIYIKEIADNKITLLIKIDE